MTGAGLPADFVRRMGEAFGEAGQRWVADLPQVIEAMAEAWGLTVAPHYELSYNFVAPAITAQGAEVVLKLGCPRPEFDLEIAALRLYAGHGCARLLAADANRGALLLERLRPGHTLATLADDDAATRTAAGVMAALWQPPPAEHDFPTTQHWMKGLERLRARYAGGAGPFPPALVDRAERLSAELHASGAPAVVLHGDLHHYNILRAERAPWLAIDPQGVVGEPAFETGALLRNPLPQVYAWPDFEARTARRVAILAECLEVERQRIAAWGVAQAVLSAWWTIEDHGTLDEDVLRLGEVLARLA
jgi:streptomycin 6-kinase